MLALAGLLIIIGDEGAAVSRYREVLVLTDRTLLQGHPDHWTRFARGEAFIAQNDLAAALAEFGDSLEAGPPPGDVRSEVGQLRSLQDAGWRLEITAPTIELLAQTIPAEHA